MTNTGASLDTSEAVKLLEVVTDPTNYSAAQVRYAEEQLEKWFQED